jgi:hypothetical protein
MDLPGVIDEMIEYRQSVCQEYALTINHQHCIGCSLVLDFMQKEHPNMVYGSVDQWVIESAFCARHEREIFIDFLKTKGIK